jgi:RNA recognition motif 2
MLWLGPDGRYTQVDVPPRSGSGYISPNHVPHHYDYGGGIPGEVPSHSASGRYPQHHPGGYPSSSSMTPSASRNYPSHAPPAQYMDRCYPPHGVNHVATPYYAHTVTPMTTADSSSSSLGRSMRSGHSTGGPSTDPSHPTGGGDKGHLLMDLDLVELGQDTRTSLMVRNITNKYTQQMLLSEFEANGHGPGIIDFLYLPIDFKNRCNRGYAFINFVYYKDILSFHRRYFGKRWRTFNSDKICDITYARIQGKDAMLKRFENSALMEKDDEYKPLVFASDGLNRGTCLPFPDPNMHYNNDGNQGHHPPQQQQHHMAMMNAAVGGRAEA